jgi:ABC-type oligopeptide transport system substrate-binding subunit
MKTVNSNSKRTGFFKHSSRRQINELQKTQAALLEAMQERSVTITLAKTINWFYFVLSTGRYLPITGSAIRPFYVCLNFEYPSF